MVLELGASTVSERMAEGLSKLQDKVASKIPVGTKLVVGISGGLDSVCLSHILHVISKTKELGVVLAHVDHALRPDSSEDFKLVTQLADSWGLELEFKQLEAPSSGENVEQWGRKERYKFFREVKRKHQADFIVTAHTASDLVETMLMRLISNKDIGRGIVSIDEELGLLRPMTDIFRAELETYCEAQGLKFHEDSTNSDESFLRNKVRNSLLPFLKDNFNDRIDRILYDRSLALISDWSYARSFTGDLLADLHCHAWGSKAWFDRLEEQLEKLDEEGRWRLIREAFYPEIKFNLSRNHCQRLEEFVLLKRKEVQLPGGYSATRSKGSIVWQRKSSDY